MARHSVLLKIKDRKAVSEFENIISAIPGYLLEFDERKPHDLMIIEITNGDAAGQFDYIRDAVSSGRAGHVFLVSGAMDPEILIQALKVGAKEFFQLPLSQQEIRNALLSFQATNTSSDTRTRDKAAVDGTLIHLMGSKGGVGTTTLAVNLAVSLLEKNKKVALIDMNLLFGDIPVFLGMESPLFDWTEIARNISRLDSSFLMGTLYKHRSGLHVLPAPSGIFETFTGGTEIITKLLGLMKTMFDFVIVDGGQELGEMSKAIMKLSEKVIIVTLLNLPGLINVKRLKETFLRLGYPSDDRISIVANRVHKRSSDISIQDAERTVKKKINWTVPNDFQNTMQAINIGKTLTEIAPNSEINKQMCRMADLLRTELLKSGVKQGLKKKSII